MGGGMEMLSLVLIVRMGGCVGVEKKTIIA